LPNLRWFQIDWGWSDLGESERKRVRAREAMLQSDPGSHSLDWLAGFLQRMSNELRGRRLIAIADGDFEIGRWLLIAEEGESKEAIQIHDAVPGDKKRIIELSEDAPLLRCKKEMTERFVSALKAGDYEEADGASFEDNLVPLPVDFVTRANLNEIANAAAAVVSEPLETRVRIAEAHYLLRLIPGSLAEIVELEPYIENAEYLALYNDVMKRAKELFPVKLKAVDFLAAGVDRLARAFQLPTSMIDEILGHAARLDRSLSWVIQRSWAEATEAIDALEAKGAAAAMGDSSVKKRRQVFHFPTRVLITVEQQASRLDLSHSSVLSLAWTYGRDALARIPSSTS